MAEDQAGGVVSHRSLHHLARMHIGGVDRPAKQYLEGHDPVFVVQKQAGENFMLFMSELSLQVVAHLSGVFQR